MASSKGGLPLAVLVAMAITLQGVLVGGAEGLSPFLKRVMQQEERGGMWNGEVVQRVGSRALLGKKEEGGGGGGGKTPPPGSCSADKSKCKKEGLYKSFGTPSCCDGVCVDVDAHDRHCGSCGSVCSWGLKCCKGKCRDLKTDHENCGKVGHKCRPGAKCEFGMCGYAN